MSNAANRTHFITALDSADSADAVLAIFAAARAAGLEVSISHEIENRAYEGTIFEAAFDVMCGEA